MSYVIAGGVCLIIGAGAGTLLTALCVAAKRNDRGITDEIPISGKEQKHNTGNRD